VSAATTTGNLLIVGCGMLGASVGLAVKRAVSSLTVTGFDVRPAAAREAMNRGAVDREASYLDAAAERADLIVLALPVDGAEDALEELAHAETPARLITDTLSTKRRVVALAGGLPWLEHRFVGAHPMAGGEQSGPAAARADLFDNAPCFITPTAQTPPEVAEAAELFWSSLGCNVARTYASHHDRMVAQVSHLPHVAAAALARLPEDVAVQFAGRGWRDTTRIAKGNAELWAGILQDNADEVLLATREMVDDLRSLATALEMDNRDAIRTWLAEAAERAAGRRRGGVR
jgi:prephenate dehydrogenase/cyclohexadieny/prephenate dehydrogenase